MSDDWGQSSSRASWVKYGSPAAKDDGAWGQDATAGWTKKPTKKDPVWDNDDSAGWNDHTRGDENVQPPASRGAFENDDPDHASAGEGLGKDDFACRNCGEQGHFARNCPGKGDVMTCYNCGEAGHAKADCPKPTQPRACFNCGEEGHTKAECTNPRVFQGTCRICNKEGHPAAQCPERPPDICKNCKGEGHKIKECTANRKFDLDHVPDKLPDEAWDMMRKASGERDLDDFREAFMVYSKAAPHATFVEIETKIRAENFNIFLIALEKEVGDVRSVIDLQGQLDRQYVVGFFFSPRPQRSTLRLRWPASDEDNLKRLANAGLPYDRKIPKCYNCGEFGHIARSCPQERSEVECVEVKCVNCNAIGHRVRDCKETRRNKFGCRNCGSQDHLAAECPEPPSADNVECRKCHQTGHFAKDCPDGGGPRTCRKCGSEDHIARDCDQPQDVSSVICRNCDQPGHFARDCTERKNWSKVKCNTCGEMGHTVRRCPQADEGPKVGKLIDTGDDWQAGKEIGDWNAGGEAADDRAPDATAPVAEGQDDHQGAEQVGSHRQDW